MAACCTALVWSVFRKEEKVKFMYEYSHQLNNALRRLIYIERVYPEFASLETSNYDQLLTYFEKIWFIGYVTDPSSRMDLTLGTIERQLEHWASFRKLTGSQRKEAHARLLSSFEKLQQVFLSSDEDNSIVKASAVVLCVLEAVGGLYSILAPARSKDLLDIQ
ncbi:hypothetical protein J132_01494 [Termitomyces sp. J132]|nr:hypothetical protein H2248_001631 [Termitomyces sp. 'cryptogamus']KNZ72981.1 hypothetical protein J132_01494 [Termitomyces sp. J132]